MLSAIVMDRRRGSRLGAPAAPRGVALSILVLVALVASMLSQIGHFMLVRHSLCEHGDIVHVEGGAREVASSAREERGREPVATQGAAAHEGEHEHCDGNALRCRVDAAPPFALDALLLTFAPEPVTPERAEVRAVDALALAPKSSPPRA